MVLDQPTLVITTAAVIGFTGLVMVLLQRPLGTLGPLLVWGVAMLLGSLGILLGAVSRATSWLPEGVSTAVLLAAPGCSWTAARLFAGRRPVPVLVAAAPAAWLVTIPVQDDQSGWIAASCLIGAAFTGSTAVELMHTRPAILPSRAPAVVLLLIHAAAYLLRGGAALLPDEPHLPWLANVLLLESLVNTVGTALLLTGMVKERAEQRTTATLLALARQDALTGIANRRHFDEQLAEQLRRAGRSGSGPALLMIDVDHFKAYNDAAGHHDGDICLRRVAQTIARHVRRPGDLAARYGGEEFAVILADTDLAGALAVAEAIRDAVAGMGLLHPTSGGPITVSVGVADLPADAPSPQPAWLVRHADGALYRAKSAGRNAVRHA